MFSISTRKLHPFRFVALLSLLTLVLTACGGQSTKIYDVAIHISSASQQAKVDGFKQGMKTLGYIEGTNIRYHEITYIDVVTNTSPTTKAQFEAFVAKDYDAFWATNQTAARTIKPLLNNRPMIVAGMSDPVGNKLVQNINQSGTNITGIDSFEYDIAIDRLRWITKLAPEVKSVYLLYFPSVPNYENYLKLVRNEAQKLNVRLIEKPIDESRGTDRDPSVFIPKFNATEAQAILAIGDAPITSLLEELKPVIEREKLVMAGGLATHLDYGALFTYSPSLAELGRQSAPFVSKILNGANPATMPIATPDKFDLVINQKLAVRLNKDLPPAIVAAADNVIK